MSAKSLPSPELLRQLLRYEPDTGKLYWKERTPNMFKRERDCKGWNLKFSGKEAFTAKTANGYHHGAINCTNYYAHRIIFSMAYGSLSHGEIDHVNGDKSDNRLGNLREVSHAENMKNAKIQKNNVSGFSGVHYEMSSRKWRATISVDGKVKGVGRFSNKDDAIAARKEAEAKYGFHPNHGRA